MKIEKYYKNLTIKLCDLIRFLAFALKIKKSDYKTLETVLSV